MATNGDAEYIRVKAGYLEIRQKLDAGRPSASGKNLTVATTGGFKDIEGTNVRINLTAIRPV